MSSKKFVRLCNDYYEGGKMVPFENWHTYITNNKQPWYKSVGTYTEEQVKLFKERKSQLKPGAKGEGSVAGMTGIKTNCLVLDYDNKENLEEARQATITAIRRLENLGVKPETVNISFTGSKGFAVEVFTEKDYTSKQFKTMAENLSEGLECWDTTLYDENQLIRIPGTRHKDTGLYKTTLTVDELKNLTMDQIKTKANGESGVEWTEFPNSIPEVLLKPKFKEKPKKETKTGDAELDFSTKPSDMPNWKFAILHGFFPPGKRHESMLALASFYKGMGYPQELTESLVLGASRLQYDRFSDHYPGGDPTNEGELTRTIEHIYGPTWTGGTFAYETNEKLKESILGMFPEETFEIENPDNKVIKSANDIIEGFKIFSKNIEKNRIYTGIPEVDKNIMLTVGAMHGVLAAPGAGKTALAINMLAHNSKAGLPCMFFSLDMSENLIGGKLMARQSPIGFRELTEKYKNNIDLREVETLVEEDFKNVAFYSKSATSVKDMRQTITKHQKNIGQQVKFVVVDYLELIAGPYADATANSAHHAVHLKDLATDLDICLIILVQPQKSAGDASSPLNSMRNIKGASLLEQNFRNVLGLYREGFSPNTPENDRYMTIKGLKSSFESLFSVDVGWDGKTGKVYTLSPQERHALANLRDKKAAEKEIAEKDKNGGW